MDGNRQRKLLILNYYHVTDVSDNNNSSRIHISYDTFSTHISTLLNWCYYPITMDDLVQFFYNDIDLPSKALLVTFGNGYKDIFTKALPVLKRFNIPAHIFLVSDFLEKEFDLNNSGEPDVRNKLLSLTDIIKLKKTGLISFGSHSRTHKKLTELSDEDLHNEIAGSKFKLEKLIGTEIPSFCYPFGIFNNRIIQSVSDAGYKFAFIPEKTRLKKELDFYSIPLTNMLNKDKDLRLWYKIFMSEKKTYNLIKTGY